MDKIIIVNAFTQKIETVFLDNISENNANIIEIAREDGETVGKIGNDIIIRVVKNLSLSISIDNAVYTGGIFIISKDESVSSSFNYEIPLFNSINYNVSLAREILRLMKRDFYSLDDRISLKNKDKDISIREFIKNCSELPSSKQIEIYKLLYSANNSFYDDGTIYTIEHLVRAYVS